MAIGLVFRCVRRISKRGCVRPSVCPSVHHPKLIYQNLRPYTLGFQLQMNPLLNRRHNCRRRHHHHCSRHCRLLFCFLTVIGAEATVACHLHFQHYFCLMQQSLTSLSPP